MTEYQWDLPEPFTMPIRVAAEDIDRLGHTNNQVYLRWMEELSWRHVEHLGCGWEAYQRLRRAMAIRRTEVDYLGASHAGDELIMATWITASDGRLHSERRFQLVAARDGRTLLRARVSYVCIDLDSGRPRRMPAEFTDFHQRALIPEPPGAGG